MSFFTYKKRFKIALGGFLFFVGFLILVFTMLAVAKTIDVGNILQLELLVYVILVIGILDILSGILLLRSR